MNKKNDGKSDQPACTLLTNIDFVQFGEIRLDCHALLIEENYEPMFADEPATRLRGFGTDGAWTVFTLWFPPKTTWKLEAAEDPTKIIVSEDGKEKPIFRGAMLEFSDARKMFLQIMDDEQPLDVIKELTDYGQIWNLVSERTERYYDTPNMPRLSWYPSPRSRRNRAGGQQRKKN